MEDLRDALGSGEESLENLEELLEIVKKVEKDLEKVSPQELMKGSAYGEWEKLQGEELTDVFLEDKEEGIKEVFMPDKKLSALNNKEVYLKQFGDWFKVNVLGDKVRITSSKGMVKELSVENFLKILKEEKEVEYRDLETGNSFLGRKVEVESLDKRGYVVKELEGNRFLVELEEPFEGSRFIIVSSRDLKFMEAVKPGEIVKAKDRPEEYTVLEVDEATGKAKVKSKTTGEETYMDVEHLEKASSGRIKMAQEEFPYRERKVEIKEEFPEEEIMEIPEEKLEEKPEKTIEEEPEVVKDEETLLTETIKSVFKDPEIAVQVVDKLLAVIEGKGLEKELMEKLSSKNFVLDDLLCSACYRERGEELAQVFKDLLGDEFKEVIQRGLMNLR